jgi:hypothetical protein
MSFPHYFTISRVSFQEGNLSQPIECEIPNCLDFKISTAQSSTVIFPLKLNPRSRSLYVMQDEKNFKLAEPFLSPSYATADFVTNIVFFTCQPVHSVQIKVSLVLLIEFPVISYLQGPILS